MHKFHGKRSSCALDNLPVAIQIALEILEFIVPGDFLCFHVIHHFQPMITEEVPCLSHLADLDDRLNCCKLEICLLVPR